MKVLSIDFDLIMYPCIKLYNNLCRGNENATVLWQEIENQLNVDKFLCYDANVLIKIAKIIKNNVLHGAKLIPIEEHQQIVAYLPETEKIELLNIDFHHDILYNPDNLLEMADFGNYNCGNWVGYLFMQDRLSKYSWLKAPQSSLYNMEIKPFDHTILGLKDLDKVENNYDYVFFCFSPQWVPYKYRHLYDLILELVKEE